MVPLLRQYKNTKKSWELKALKQFPERDRHSPTERVNLAEELYSNNCFSEPPPCCVMTFSLVPELLG